jgi:ribosomal protein S3
VLGVKVWIFKGEVFGDQPAEEPPAKGPAKAAGMKG